LWIEDAGRAVVLLPGPPRELKPLFREQVLPRLERRVSGVRLYSRELRVTAWANRMWSSASCRFTSVIPRCKPRFSPRPAKRKFICVTGPKDAARAKQILNEIVQGFEIALADRHLQPGRPLAGRNRRRATYTQQCDYRRGGKLYWRVVRATADQHRRQLVLFSWRPWCVTAMS